MEIFNEFGQLTMPASVVLIVFMLLVVFTLIYAAIRTEQIWSHLSYEKHLKDIRLQAALEDKNKN